MNGKKEIVYRGGTDMERLYLADDEFTLESGERVIVQRTDIPGGNMVEVVARHRGRYALVRFLCKPGVRVLDFPCGSGYGAEELISVSGIQYEGRDRDEVTIEYARRQYGRNDVQFDIDDLRVAHIQRGAYNVIACIEGLEHVEREYHEKLIENLAAGLDEDGVLVISSPENPTGKSGPSVHNRYHPGELTAGDFIALLQRHFPRECIEVVTQRAALTTNVCTRCLYAICRRRTER